MIEVQNVSKKFYNVNALSDVSFSIKRGDVTALLGPNGAGKSTLFKIIAGLVNPDEGAIRPVRQGWPTVAYKPDRLIFPNNSRVRDYLTTIAQLSNVSGREMRKQVSGAIDQVRLSDAADKKIGVLSKGMRQRLGLAQTMIGSPSLILLDEPTNGLDPAGQVEILEHIAHMRAAGQTVLVSSHQLQEVTKICTNIVIIGSGRIRYQNSIASALAVRPKVVIKTDRDLTPIRQWLLNVHTDIVIEGSKLTIGESALESRRRVLTLLLGAGYDILHIDYNRVTLDEIYAEAIQ